LVATVGQLTLHPGAANVVPGEVTLSLDVRHPDDGERRLAAEHLIDIAGKIGKHRSIAVTTNSISDNPAISCSTRLTSVLEQAIKDLGVTPMQLASGAGHDAVVMAGLTDVAMLFVRCKGGISHNPAESVTEDDIAVAIDVLSKFLELLAAER
jgi:acetylornithine deacetylase/succinyl-diaminopimelate desuccinylase-like protein